MKGFSPVSEIVLAAIIWGSSGAFVKFLDLPTTTITFFRVFVPTVVLLVFFWFKRVRLFSGNNRLMLFASSLNAVRMFLYFVGFTFTTIGNAVILWYTKPIFVVILSVWLLKERMRRVNYFYLFLCFVGILFIFGGREFSFESDDFVGMLAMVLGAAVASFANIIYKKESKRYSNFEMIFYQNLVGAVVFFPFVFVNLESLSLMKVSVASVYALLIGIVGFGLFFSAIKRINISTASIVAYLEVVSGVLFGVFLFGEVLSWNVVVGGGLILVSTLMLKK